MSKKKGQKEKLPKEVQCDACGNQVKSVQATRIKATLREISDDAIYEGSNASVQLLICPKCADDVHAAMIRTIKAIQQHTAS